MTKRKKAVDGLDLPTSVSEDLRRYGGFDKLVDSLPPKPRLDLRAGQHFALSDITRLRILHLLSGCSLCPCLLKRITRVVDSKLSYHLKVLERAGLIKARRTKNWRVYSITTRGRRAISP